MNSEVTMNDEEKFKFKYAKKIKEVAKLQHAFVVDYIEKNCNDLSDKEKFFIHLNSLGVNVGFLLFNCLENNDHRLEVLENFRESVKLNLIDDCFFKEDEKV